MNPARSTGCCLTEVAPSPTTRHVDWEDVAAIELDDRVGEKCGVRVVLRAMEKQERRAIDMLLGDKGVSSRFVECDGGGAQAAELRRLVRSVMYRQLYA